MRGIGVPEGMFILVILTFYLIPIVAGVWAVVTLQRLRTGQDAIRQRLDAIELALRPPAA